MGSPCLWLSPVQRAPRPRGFRPCHTTTEGFTASLTQRRTCRQDGGREIFSRSIGPERLLVPYLTLIDPNAMMTKITETIHSLDTTCGSGHPHKCKWW